MSVIQIDLSVNELIREEPRIIISKLLFPSESELSLL